MLKKIAKNILSSKLWLRSFKGRNFILVYHDISDFEASHYSNSYSTPKQLFFEHIDALSKQVKFVTLNDLLSGFCDPSRINVAITFDDGFRSVFEIARPFLNDRNIPYAVFINSTAIKSGQSWQTNMKLFDLGYIQHVTKQVHIENATLASGVSEMMINGVFDQEIIWQVNKYPFKSPFMTSEMISVLNQEQVIIGNHGANHYVLSACSSDILATEVMDSQKYLEELTLTNIQHFAIPFGKKQHYSDEVIECIKQSHDFCYTTNPNVVRTIEDQFKIPRIVVCQESLKDLMFYLNRTLFFHYDL